VIVGQRPVQDETQAGQHREQQPGRGREKDATLQETEGGED
jgi:hypothetical protein